MMWYLETSKYRGKQFTLVKGYFDYEKVIRVNNTNIEWPILSLIDYAKAFDRSIWTARKAWFLWERY